MSHKRDDIVILDNLGSYKGQAVRAAAELGEDLVKRDGKATLKAYAPVIAQLMITLSRATPSYPVLNFIELSSLLVAPAPTHAAHRRMAPSPTRAEYLRFFANARRAQCRRGLRLAPA